MPKVTVTQDEELANEIRSKVKENGGYCPCALEKTKDTICMCKDFRDKLEDDNFFGECHCGLYIKERV